MTSSSDVAVSMDGDRQRPIGIFTNCRYGRQQVTREIDYYVPVGTPCLVHDHHAMGSTVGPKVRWGIASSMHRDVPEFLCPFANTTFRSKSYVAYKLKEGLNYEQFLSIKQRKISSRRSVAISGNDAINEASKNDPNARWVQLPKGWLTSDEMDEAIANDGQ